MRYGLTCISYPSVANQNHRDCIALSPNVADECLNLDYVEQIHVIEKTDDIVRFTPVDISQKIAEDGSLSWKGAPGASIIPAKHAGKTITVTNEGGQIVMRLPDGSLLPPS